MGSLDGRSDRAHKDKSNLCGTENLTQKSDFITMSEGGSFSGVGSMETLNNGVCRSIKTVVFSNKLNLLMPFGPLAILVHLLTGNQVNNCLHKNGIAIYFIFFIMVYICLAYILIVLTW